MVSRLHSQKKVPQSTSAPVQNQLRSRPFAPPVQAETTPQAEVPDLQTQLETATRLGHSFSRMTARNAPTPPDAPATVFPRFPIQPKLTIGAPGDKYEQEADRVASQVVQRLNAPSPSAPSPERSQSDQSVQRETIPDEDKLQMKPLADEIQRVEMPEEEELQMKPIVQRQAGGEAIAATTELEGAIQQSRGSGQTLAESIRQPMEQAFGNVDFSGVNVHTDARSDQLNRSLQSKAFTTGQDVFFRQGTYDPATQKGQELIAHELTHVVQQNGKVINRSYGNVVQRMTIEKSRAPNLGDIVSYSEGEEMPQTGNGYTYKELNQEQLEVYKVGFDLKKRYFIKKQETTKEMGTRRIQMRQSLQKPLEILFDAQNGGAIEGSFEYVANYLYAEVVKVKKLEDPETREIWEMVWAVKDNLIGEPEQTRIESAERQSVLKKMIAIGLDAEWKKLAVKDLMTQEVNSKKPAAAMANLEVPPDIWTCLSNIWNWRPWSAPKNLGVAFHTTDGSPDKVMKNKSEGGWEGITRPMTAPFFQKRYALNEGWNPLGGWLEAKGPTFRKGIKDNELLSTVSLATDLHGSVKFPLANKNRQHKLESKEGQDNRFMMTAYSYAVTFDGAYATFAKQDNPYPEIATGDVPIKDIIGHAVVTRWHDYHDKETKQSPDDASFVYEISQFNVNSIGSKNDKLTQLAKGAFDKERAKTGKKYNPNFE